ncbi:MAG: hypothetical protein HC852_19785 [Acaryochloridaceae cyanobacterium RU_4_10]|nr:hypothetical protein [Acaryochloridaceae cyanobacterium RU_4_10]
MAKYEAVPFNVAIAPSSSTQAWSIHGTRPLRIAIILDNGMIVATPWRWRPRISCPGASVAWVF